MKARYVCSLQTRYFKNFAFGQSIAVSISEKGNVRYTPSTEEPVYYLFEGRYDHAMEVVYSNKRVYICQSVDGLVRQAKQLSELAESLDNFTLWIASSVVIDDLILMKVRKQLLTIPQISKWYERFNKLRALAISTDKTGERDTAIRKAVAVGLRISEGRV